MKTKRKAVVLLSGGLDSATVLAYAARKGFECFTISFDYGQRHRLELKYAKRISRQLKAADNLLVSFNLRKWGGSALTSSMKVPKGGLKPGIPVTYVPARNTIFLSFAISYAEAICAKDIFIGVNSLDYSGYPDCRPQFIDAFAKCANLGTKATDEGWKFKIHAPLQKLTKAQIIRLGIKLGVDYSLTSSCYDPDTKGHACGKCDSCRLRKKGFAEAGVRDPTVYVD